MSSLASRPSTARVLVSDRQAVLGRFGPEEIDEMITHLERIAVCRRFDCTDRVFAIDALERLGAPSLLALTRIADDGLRWSTVRQTALLAIGRIQQGEEAPKWIRPEPAAA